MGHGPHGTDRDDGLSPGRGSLRPLQRRRGAAVGLDAGDEKGAVIGPNARFGVFDILSGRPRLGDAVAVTDTRVLIIEAEDFFDLLSNNIEIVRALFSTVIALSEDADERLL